MTATVVISMRGAARADDTSDEAQAGSELFDSLKKQGEIVQSSPLYDIVNPIGNALIPVVQPQYPLKMHLYIVHENQPNAFAAPGGNVYVVDSLLYFAKNKEELEGVLCHETSHLIHHDTMALMKRNQEIQDRAVAATILLGPSIATVLATTAIARLDALHYSRQAEENADLLGADNCAKAGFNPWGLVWLFEDFSNANLKTPPEFLSDHPNDEHRVAALKQHFMENPALFSRFSSNRSTATPITLPKSEDEVFLR